MNLHLFTDSFFVDKVIPKYEEYGDDNLFIVFSPSIKLVKNTSIYHFRSYSELKKSNINLREVRKIFIHYLGGYAVDFILDNPKLGTYFWFFWGADGYSLKGLRENVLLPKTKRNAKEASSVFSKYRRMVIRLIKQMDSRKRRALKHIDYCCTWVHGDYELIKSTIPCELKFHFFSYLSAIDLFRSDVVSSDINYDDLHIMAGNSLNATNNHFELVDYIQSSFNNVSRVVMPISYSGSETYKSRIKQYVAKSLLPVKYLESFMPIHQYLDLINSCDIIVFFHLRQQAANNSLSVLWMGKILVMHPDSTLFRFFSEQGLSVVSYKELKSISDLKKYDRHFHDRKERNRVILNSLFSEEEIEKMYRFLFTNK
ncbi:TDP-N-acetylfucosamine:lipid II N-acetylfucosaminyltransferase [Roseivirga pacifica]|uniref:TDP-N-acetylfucosamine:lipid II N-acetylfucosaminyltransferase n=1 Tax=Roseivirga pacifica TaxID=1267423 RepID=UPI003BB0BCC4